jgi:hypothetical protein
VANVFRFEKPDKSGQDRQITIVGFFALPGVGMTPDADVVRSRSARRAVSSRGAGQVQVLFDGFPSFEKAGAVASDLLQSIPPATFEMLIDDRADEGASRIGDASRSKAGGQEAGGEEAGGEDEAAAVETGQHERMVEGIAGGEP